MALSNFTIANSVVSTPVFVNKSASFQIETDDLLYSPADHQQNSSSRYDLNLPFTKPGQSQKRKSKIRKRSGPTYLPPPPNQYTQYSQFNNIMHNPYNPYNPQTHQHHRLDVEIENQPVHEINKYSDAGQYIQTPAVDFGFENKKIDQISQRHPLYNPNYISSKPELAAHSVQNRGFQGINQNVNQYVQNTATTQPATVSNIHIDHGKSREIERGYVEKKAPTPPEKPRGFTKVESGSPGGKTQLHAVLDYDDDYSDDGLDITQQAVTPVEGPILLRNGKVPVVPLTSYQTVNNGTFYQIPILWTALSLALGYELQGQVIRGVPCVKRDHQLYCPTAGNTYPLEKIETFIDENKALIRRMYGSFSTPDTGGRGKRSHKHPDLHGGDSFFRHTRQAGSTRLPDPKSVNSTGRVDACESKTDIMTPYWALNSARKLRAVVNTMHFEQAIHQEVCTKETTSRCSRDCGCEQKYKWHRLLAYDPDDDCAGIFMDWFLFPSCCVCRCKP